MTRHFKVKLELERSQDQTFHFHLLHQDTADMSVLTLYKLCHIEYQHKRDPEKLYRLPV